MVRDLLPGVRTVAQRFAIMLFQRQILRLADDLDGRHSVRDWDEDPAAFARRIQPQQSLPPRNGNCNNYLVDRHFIIILFADHTSGFILPLV